MTRYTMTSDELASNSRGSTNTLPTTDEPKKSYRATIVKGIPILQYHFHKSIVKKYYGLQATPGTDLKCGHYALAQALSSRAMESNSLGLKTHSEYAQDIFNVLEKLAQTDQGEKSNISAYALRGRLLNFLPDVVLAIAQCHGLEDGVRTTELVLTSAEDCERLFNGAEVMFIHNRQIQADLNHWESIGPADNIFCPIYPDEDGQIHDGNWEQMDKVVSWSA